MLFGIAGDHILHFLDCASDADFRMVDTRHESAAVHAADAYARTLRRAGVVFSTTPGHANAVPGLANAMHSQSPVVNFAGSAESSNLGRGAMQEFNQVGVAEPICKGAWMVPAAERIPEYVALAFRTALAGRHGPVHLTIPHDLQEAQVTANAWERYAPREYGSPRAVLGDTAQIAAAIDLLHSAERPLILAGTGAGFTADPTEMQRLVEITQTPFCSVDSARSLIPDSHDLSIGLGYLPLNPAVQRISEADVVLLLGKSLDYTMGFGGSPPFNKEARLIMVNPSVAEVGRARSVAVGIVGTVGSIVTQLADEAARHSWSPHKDWLKSLKSTWQKWLNELDALATDDTPLHPMRVSTSLRPYIDDNTHITFDGGDYCHFLRASTPRQAPFMFENVSSFGMIGVGIAYGVGAQVALPDSRVVVAVGDGSLGFNVAELDTMVRHNLPVKVIVGGNNIWGIDWQIQKGLFGRTVWTELRSTRWDKVAEGFGALGLHVTNASELKAAVSKAMDHNGPALVNVEVAPVISHVAEAAISRKLGSHG